MKVTYLNHSGFLLEWEHSCWLFDYYKGEIPELDPRKDIFVFCSHSHGDHFNPAVFALAEKYPSVVYVFSNQVKRAYRKLQRTPGGLQIPDIGRIPIPEVQFIRSRTDMELQDSQKNVMKIHALQSTDCGCAFVVEYEGKVIYHAGDLHWWSWPEEGDAWNRKMEADYKKEMEYLEGTHLDLAFTPLDPRQEDDYALGMNYLLEKAEVKRVFPMHFWDDFSVMEQYLKENQIPEQTQFYRLEQDGQRFEIGL